MRVLVVDGVDAALAGASALIGAVGDSQKRYPDNGEYGEENEDNHQVLPGPSPFVACVPVAANLFCS